MESIVSQLQGIQANLDILHDHKYEDCNKMVAYRNDIRFSQSEIMEHLKNVDRSQRWTNECLQELEDRLENIESLMHESQGQLVVVNIHHLRQPLWNAFDRLAS